MSAARDRAVKSLKHYIFYFQGLRPRPKYPGGDYDSDNESEVELIVDDIIEAAAEKAYAKAKKDIDALRCSRWGYLG